MAINFPSAPNTGDSHTDGSVTWIYNGSAWDSLYQPTAKAQVGLGNVDNTSDEDKPVSTAQQAALDALTKDDVGLDNVDNTSDINKPVSTAQQAAIDAAAGSGGSSFDQDLNTTDSPTFDTLTTTNTIANDVYAVDVGASGTVTADDVHARLIKNDLSQNVFWMQSSKVICYKDWTPNGDGLLDNGTTSTRWATIFTQDLDASGTVTAGEVTTNQINSPNSFVSFQPSNFERLQITSSDIRPNSFGDYDLGRSTNTFNDCYLHGTLFTADIDATGTVTASKGLFNTPTVGSQYALEVQSNGTKNFTIDGYGTAESKGLLPRSANVFNVGASNRRWKEVFTQDLDASGTVKKGVYTVATLPTGEAGMTCFVSDANATTRGSTVAGGGANFMPVYSDGTNWIIS